MLNVVALLFTAAASGTEGAYEDRLIEWGLALRERKLEPHPEGKRIEELLVAGEDVFSKTDPWPDAFNYIHIRTREEVILREVLLKPGDAWDPVFVEETERNLRRLFIFAVARVVPVQGKNGGVGLLVVIKDRLSLRLNSYFNIVGDLLQLLLLRPTEQNFLGRGQTVVLEFLLYLDTLQISESFRERRLFGTRLSLFEFVGIVLNRQTGQPEGTVGDLQFGLPIVSLDQKWAFNVEGSWTVKTARTFCGPVVCNQQSPGTATSVPRIYDVRQYRAEASLTRTFGSVWKSEVTAALGGYTRHYTPPANARLTEDQVALLRDVVLPRSDDATYVSGFFRFFKAEFAVLRNIDTYDLSEDYQMGPVLQVGARWAIPTFTPTHFIELGGSLKYRLLIAEDLITFSVAAAVRVVPGGEAVNRHVAAELVNATPQFEGGRLVTRVLVDFIKFDLDKRIELLGGGNGLRGAPPELLSGRNLFLLNVEYRARPFEFRTLFIGFVLFYDAGSAFDTAITLTHTFGLGLRILVPQFNQETIRFDFGFVIGAPGVVGIDRLNATYGQVTDLRPVFLDNPLGGGCETPSCK